MNQRFDIILNYPALIPVTGNFDRKPRSLDRDVTSIGRARGSDLCLEANEISTLHCIIYRTVDGFRIRDCNSRTGTRVNGELIKNHTLREGDIINLGPFSFELRIPRDLFPKEGQKLDPVRVAHWARSRRNLALHALKLRRRLRCRPRESGIREKEMVNKAHLLKEKIRSYDHRTNELEEAERELNEERAQLAEEKEAHRELMRVREQGLADQLAQTEQEIHKRWQEFQQRCQADEARLRMLSASVSAQSEEESDQESSAPREAIEQLQRELDEQEQRLQELEERLSRQQQQLHHERQEFLTMKEQWVQNQSKSTTSLEEQKAALAQQESALRTQKTELMRMMADLKKMQEDVRKQSKGELRTLQTELDSLRRENAELQAQLKEQDNLAEVRAVVEENDKLRSLVEQLQQRVAATPAAGPAAAEPNEESLRQMESLRAEIEQLYMELETKESRITELQHQPKAVAGGAADKHAQQLSAENELLKKLLQEKDTYVEEMNSKLEHRPKNETDLDRYETELNEYRRQLDTDRAKLNTEVELMRERNQELDEAVREMEMEMSKERAELARERIRLERVRDEIKADMERLQREIAVRDSMAPVQKLREELTGKQATVNGLTK